MYQRYFNSQPHEEADQEVTGMAYADYISTHSLTKRLTVLQHFTRLGLYISTHSLTKRLTRDGEYYVPDWAVFQLTASRRG